MVPGDLTTLGNVKAWLSTSNYNSTGIGVDPLLQQLITRQSNAIMAYLNRSWILPRDYVDVVNGEGQLALHTTHWPVNSVSAVLMNGQPLQLAPLDPFRSEGAYGYRVEPWNGAPPGGPQMIGLSGGRFCKGFLNIEIDYNAGYLVSKEPHIITPSLIRPTPTNVTIDTFQPHGMWGQDIDVTRGDGTPMTRVFTAPSASGEYQIIMPDEVVGTPPNTSLTPSGQYVFFGGDQGQTVLISYGYIPSALEQVAIELILERYMYRTRIGEVSRTVAQQVTARYDLSEIPAYAKHTLQAYMHVLMT